MPQRCFYLLQVVSALNPSKNQLLPRSWQLSRLDHYYLVYLLTNFLS